MECRELSVDKDIRLKEIGLEDVEAIFSTIDNERSYLGEWLPFVDLTNDIAFTRNFVAGYLNSDRVNITCAIYYKNIFAGLVGLKDTDLINKKIEIGYWLSEPFQHKGIITRSCKSLIDYAFRILGMNRVQLKAATENFKSQRVAERLGFSFEGIERDGELHDRGFVDLKIFALLKKDFISTN